jgi:CxxC-x17-CxxC domain-containing protein
LEYRDKTLVCAGCREAFVWTAAEQLFFADHALRHEPRRCPACRKRPRVAQARAAQGRARVEVAAVCAACGRETTVPFQPSQGRPVYCRECYAKGRVKAGEQ